LALSLDIRKLRYWWLGFAVLLTGGWVTERLRYYGFTGSLSEALAWPSRFVHGVQHELTWLTLLLVVSDTTRKALWWVAIARIVFKAAVALFFFWDPFHASITFYNDAEILRHSFGLLHLSPVSRILLNGSPFSLLLQLALYAYWLWLCLRIMRTPNAFAEPSDGKAPTA
jgi:hypothetical protein